jgi:hypothetical protein
MKKKPAAEIGAAEWHTQQAAEFFANSYSRAKTANAKATARKRFVSNAKAALATMGLEPFLKLFAQWLGHKGASEHYAEAEAIVRGLGVEPAAEPATSTDRLAAIGKLIEAAVRLAMGEGK